jgi:magnesium transporter
MALISTLADALIQKHPARAAEVLEREEPAQGITLLARGNARSAAEVLRRLSPTRVGATLGGLAPRRAASLLAALPLDAAARLLRHVEEAQRGGILEHLDARRAQSLRSLMAFPADRAGALMDPEVLALPSTLSAGEALDRVRERPDHARYNLYVLDDEARLVGALNLRELFLARPEDRLGDLMKPNPQAIRSDADRATVLSHHGWREVHALPVVDADGHYLGAFRYRTLRELEEELLHGRRDDSSSATALGELFATGAAGLLDALAASTGGGANRGR